MFLDNVGVKIGVQGSDLSPWYNVSHATLHRLGCGFLLTEKYNSVYAMVKSIYPEHKWLPWKFKKLPRSLALDSEIANEVLNYIERSRPIPTREEWLKIPHAELVELGVDSIVNKMGGLSQLLQTYRSEQTL